MKNVLYLFIVILISSCRPNQSKEKTIIETDSEIITTHFSIAFGSCNNQNLPNNLWRGVINSNPNVWIWGGDIVYADTDNMSLMQSYYKEVKNNKEYKEVTLKMDILGTWDDHDYGKNDAGVEYVKKDSAQQLFLDFIGVDKNDERRNRKGVFHSKIYKVVDKSIKIILLDTRYSRSSLTEDPTKKKRYVPAKDSLGTILGVEQWKWLTKELNNSKANFNILISSIQFLSAEHGFET